jgi:hypothetical protein
MFRTGLARQLRAVNGLGAAHKTQPSSKLCTLSNTARPLAVGRPMTLALAHYATKKAPMDKVNKRAEKKLADMKLKAEPTLVSSSSSVHPVFGEVGMAEEKNKDADMMAGVKNDLVSRRLSLCILFYTDTHYPENNQGNILTPRRAS